MGEVGGGGWPTNSSWPTNDELNYAPLSSSYTVPRFLRRMPSLVFSSGEMTPFPFENIKVRACARAHIYTYTHAGCTDQRTSINARTSAHSLTHEAPHTHTHTHAGTHARMRATGKSITFI